MRTSTILCIRHCQSTGQAPDAPLTEKGHADARRLIPALQAWQPDHLVSSSYLRARQTIEPFARAVNRPVVLEDRLVEHKFCEPDFQNWRELLARSFDDLDLRCPGGETSREARARALAALAEISGRSERAALATHGKLLSMLIGFCRPSWGFADWEKLRNPDAFLFTLHDGQPVEVRQMDPFALG